jgi:tetratricopeptide (TPR) repeat protein
MFASALLLLLLQPDPAALVPLYRQALETREKQLGPDHPKVARSASDLGLYLKKLGDRESALRYLRRALAIDEKALSPSHRQVAEDLENVAALTPPAEAARLLTRAAACDDATVAARVLGKLGGVQETLGDRAAAVVSYRRALQKEESTSGGSHPRVAVRLNDLALVTAPGAAEPLLRRALAIQQQSLGAKHPETAVTMNNLANVLLASNRLPEAERVQRDALAALEEALGRGNPRVAVSCSNLGDIVRAKGDAAGAKVLYERALAINEAAYGSDHPVIAGDLDNLAGLLTEMGRKSEAARLANRAARLKNRQR